MANKSLFQILMPEFLLPSADTWNEAGGTAYTLSPKQALAVYANTGCLNSTFYASASQQLEQVLGLTHEVEPEFIAKTALYARQSGCMKDLPALLCAVLANKDCDLLCSIFAQVIDTSKMLRNFVQIMRSGAVGRRSLGTRPKRLVQEWLERHSDMVLFHGSVGQSPSLADIIKMVHPKPETEYRNALYGYLLDREHDPAVLPETVQQYEAYKKAEDRDGISFPNVPFQMLTSLELGTREWKEIARNAKWQMTRMNLNTFLRHGVFDDKELVSIVAERLRDPEAIRKAKVFPYQLLTTYLSVNESLPRAIRDSLHDAMEIALSNVPKFDGTVYILLDVSGSMHSPITGYRKGSTSTTRCIDVASLVAAALMRNCPQATVIPFNHRIFRLSIEPNDTVLTNAKRLAGLPTGGTNCSAPLRYMNKMKAKGELVIFVSDYESWIDSMDRHYQSSSTETMKEWFKFKRRNPNAKMVCIDLQPYATTQVIEREDIFNVAGFSDQVFNMLAAIVSGKSEPDYWVKQIERFEFSSRADTVRVH